MSTDLVFRKELENMKASNLTKEEYMRLKDYEEAEKLRNSYSANSWAMSSIILPICFGLIGVSFLTELLLLKWLQLLPLALASIFLCTFWLFYMRRYGGFMKTTYAQMQYLEKLMGMKFPYEEKQPN